MSTDQHTTVHFPLLADLEAYCASETDLLEDAEAREHWLDVFITQLPRQLDAARLTGASEAQIRRAEQAFLHDIDRIRSNPAAFGRLDTLALDRLRQKAFREHGIADEYRLIKQRENELALTLLPGHLAQLDAIRDPQARLEQVVHSMLAGNLFDMGATEMGERFTNESVPFAETLAMVPDRPWLVDDLDAGVADLAKRAGGKAVVFADNAGPDFMFGLLPLVREMLRRDMEVVLTANSAPSHNDITHDEIIDLMPRVIAIDSTLDTDRLRLVPNGTDTPLIDLRAVGEALADAAAGAHLLVLVGMGRALETNFSAQFTCANWRIAMVKDRQVARSLGGEMYDAVCKFTAGGSSAGV